MGELWIEESEGNEENKKGSLTQKKMIKRMRVVERGEN